MRRRSAAALLALTVLAGCGGGRAPRDEPSEPAALLPAAQEIPGWSLVEGPTAFAPETLYEHLDGGAERYLAHGFRELAHARYCLGADPPACVGLDVFDMGGELGAFGIYRAGRPPAAEPRSWGAEGYRSGTFAAAWKGAVYVHGEADDERPELTAMLERLVADVGARVPGAAALPAVLEPLPGGGLVPLSERFVPGDLLGHSFLPGGVLADYELDGLRSELFFSDLGGEGDAAAALAWLRAHLEAVGELDSERPPLGDEAFRFRAPGLGAGTALRVGRWVAGIHGELEADAREAVLADLVAALGPD
ncbi:MAG: hypothetical protein MUE90_05905 [Thermoanaerobaculales bacterium]|nr:hypothetical protein [Thermoanaerobaculales bacterium]